MLYVVGTPIGNLDDLSIRQAKTIAGAEIILTEDTRSTGNLLKKIKDLFDLSPNPQQRLISYYKEREFEKLPEIIEMLEDDKNIVLISESGMPLVSDPGYLLVNTLIKKNIPFEVIPGPTAIETALVYSGFNPQNHMFIGFFPKKKSELIKIFNQFIQIKTIMPKIVFVGYESPMRINETLNILSEIIPSTEVAVCRELTKKFEEVVRGNPSDLSKRNYKGEITLIIG